MDARSLVLRRYPEARPVRVREGMWEIAYRPGHILGLGRTEDRAWEDAVTRIFMAPGITCTWQIT